MGRCFLCAGPVVSKMKMIEITFLYLALVRGLFSCHRAFNGGSLCMVQHYQLLNYKETYFEPRGCKA